MKFYRRKCLNNNLKKLLLEYFSYSNPLKADAKRETTKEKRIFVAKLNTFNMHHCVAKI